MLRVILSYCFLIWYQSTRFKFLYVSGALIMRSCCPNRRLLWAKLWGNPPCELSLVLTDSGSVSLLQKGIHEPPLPKEPLFPSVREEPLRWEGRWCWSTAYWMNVMNLKFTEREGSVATPLWTTRMLIH